MINKEKLEKTFSNKFLDWIFNELNSGKDVVFKKENLIMEDDILKFRKYIKDRAKEQLYFPNEQTPDGDYVYYFKLKNKIFYMITFDELFFEKNTLKNGLEFVFRKTNEKPLDLIYLDEEVPQDVLENRELVEYIVVNENVKNNLNVMLLMNSIAKATNMSTIAHIKGDKEKYYLWFNGGDELKFWINDKSFQKRIFLEASNEKMEELCTMFYCSNLAVCSLGIMNKFEAKKYINGLKNFEL